MMLATARGSAITDGEGPMSATRYTGGKANELSAVGQIHNFEIIAVTKYRDLETRDRVIQVQ